MNHQITSLTISTDLPHNPKSSSKLRGRLIEHVFITFMVQLRPRYPKLFADVKAQEILNRIFNKNNGNISSFKEEQLDHIVALLYSTYPDLRYFHNHNIDGSSSNIPYPMIHYRVKKGKAVIQAFNEAIPIVEHWLSAADWQSWMSYRNVTDKKLLQQEIKITKQPVYYRLMDWLALNDHAYKVWQDTHTLKERADLLDQAITGHVRRLAQSFMEQKEWPEIVGETCMIRKIKQVKGYHHTDVALNVIFRTNMMIPPALAIGRSVSLGYGTQARTVWQEHTSTAKKPEELATVYV